MSMLARHVVPRSLAAFSRASSVSSYGRVAKHAQLAKRVWPARSPNIYTPAMSMSTKVDVADDEEILPYTLQKSLMKIVRDEKITNHSIETRTIPPDGGSFMAVRREITIRGHTENGPKEINLFVKTMLPGAEMSIYSMPEIYERETTVYLDVFKVVNELQDEAKVPHKERFHSAKTYKGVDNESIIMEDLSKRGYTMCERLQVMPLQFAEMGVQQMAKFHGMTFALEARRPEFYKEKIQTLHQPFRYNTIDWNMFVGNVSRMAATVLTPEARKKVTDYMPSVYAKYSEYTNDPSVSTLVHNDFRPNNVMVKKNGNNFNEAIVIDFQNTFYGNPIVDFLYFIYSGTDLEFRKQHLEHLKNVYHGSMAQYLKYFDLNIDSCYSRKEFDRLYADRMDYGLMVTLWLVPIILSDNGTMPDVTKVDLNRYNFQMNETVQNRVRGAVEEFMKKGYL